MMLRDLPEHWLENIRRYWIKSHDSDAQGEGPYFVKETAERALKGREDEFYITWTDGENND